MPAKLISDLGEKNAIARFTSRLGILLSSPAGPGDDAAVIDGAGRIVVTKDLLVERRHFRLEPGWSSAYDVGHKVAAQNFADVAAMGARPQYLLLGVGCPATTSLEVLDGIADGIAAVCREVGANVIGGDFVSADEIVISGTAIGSLGVMPPITLTGARDGDLLVIAGDPSLSAAGWALLEYDAAADWSTFERLLNVHRRPQPPYAHGPLFAAAGATAMTDVSDGLIVDLTNIAQASGVRLHIDTQMYAIAADVRQAAALLDIDPLQWMLHGGEAHALVATIPPSRASSLPADVSVIGHVESGSGVVVDGEPQTCAGHWEHF